MMFHRVLLTLFLIFSSVSQTMAISGKLFEQEFEYYPIKKTVIDSTRTIYNQNNEMIYHFVSQADNSIQIQIFKKVANQYQLQALRQIAGLKSDYNRILSSDDHITVFTTNEQIVLSFDEQRLPVISNRSAIDLGFWNGKKSFLSSGEILVFHNQNLPQLWVFNKVNMAWQPQSTFSINNADTIGTINAWYFNEHTNTLFVVDDFIQNEVKRYTVDFESLSITVDSKHSFDPSWKDINFQFYNNEQDVFYHRFTDRGVFFRINEDASLEQIESIELENATVKNLHTKDTYLETNPGGENYHVSVDWQGLSVVRNFLRFEPDLHYVSDPNEMIDAHPFAGASLAENVLPIRRKGPWKRSLIAELENNGEIKEYELDYADFDTLPQRRIEAYFDHGTHQLLINGIQESQGVQSGFEAFYVWHYSGGDQGLKYLSKFSFKELDALPRDYRIIGLSDKYYYLYHYQVSDDFATIITLESSAEGLQLASTLRLDLPEGATNIRQALMAEQQYLIFTHYSDTNPMIRICRAGTANPLENCNTKKLFSDREVSARYSIKKLDNTNQLLLMNSVDTRNLEDRESDYLVEINPATLELRFAQEFAPQKDPDFDDAHTLWTGYMSKNGEDLYMLYDGGDVYHYENESGSNLWKNKGLNKDVYQSYDSRIRSFARYDFSVNKQESLLLNTYGRPAVIDHVNKIVIPFSDEEGTFKRAWHHLIPDDRGVAVTDEKLALFTVLKPEPAIYVGTSQIRQVEARQDEFIEIDLSEYFLNTHSLDMDGLPDSLTFEPPFIRGTLTNEDMFVFADKPDLVSYYRIKLEYQSYNEQYLTIVPINVNDAPELTSELNTLYFQKDDLVDVDLSEYVQDPDRDKLTYKFSNLPEGVFQQGSLLSGIVTEYGEFDVSVTVSDPDGEILRFSLPITINRSGEDDNDKSSSGGTLNILALLLLLIAFCRATVSQCDKSNLRYFKS